jgi:hypothetical protein
MLDCSIPQPCTNHYIASFLQDLRNKRPTRPVGSRPPPAHFNTWSSKSSPRITESPSAPPPTPVASSDAVPIPKDTPKPVPQSRVHERQGSSMSIDEVLAGSGGRALVQPPRGRDASISSDARERTPSIQYREGARRLVEREEARKVRLAMEELDLKKEQKVYDDARDEAAELVWKHINPNATENNPNAPYAYPGLGRKASHTRSHSVGRDEREQDLQRTNSKLRKRTSMGSSTGGSRNSSLQSHSGGSESSVTANPGFSTSPIKGTSKDSEKPAALSQSSSIASDSKHRRRSSGSKRKMSGSLFTNPNDQIYEEPEEEAKTALPKPAVQTPPAPAKVPLQVRRNPFSRVQFARDNNMVRSNTEPTLMTKRIERFEIHRNPPSQSRDAGYTSNSGAAKTLDVAKPDAENEHEVKLKEGKEVRSDDIRAATSFRLKDRSAKLPTPTVVSDRPGRPIVSFKDDWKVKEIELKEEISSAPQPTPQAAPVVASVPRPLSKAATAPVLPTINFPEQSPRKAGGFPASAPRPTVSPASGSFSRSSRAQPPVINIYEDPPARPLPTASTRWKVDTPRIATPPIPTINVSQAPLSHSRPNTKPPIPTIAIQEIPSIMVSPTKKGSSVKPPSISIPPTLPTFSISEAPILSVAPTLSRGSSMPTVPSISVTPSVPSITVGGPTPSTRPLPEPKNHPVRPLPRATASSRSHWTPGAAVRTGVLCTQCALPISGRIVSAAGSRFHPECFMCHLCGEHLECVAFYPEPEKSHAERVVRIRARQRGDDFPFLPTHPTHEDMLRLEQEDGVDEVPRFYCHLDFHELFSPRCKSCKTPIEGEVIVACGAEWHAGHFFCAQCGDPFDSSTPFVEKDGYAWCVGCHTNRYSAKCKGCRKPVTDTVIKALGSEWHMGCFCCVVSRTVSFWDVRVSD